MNNQYFRFSGAPFENNLDQRFLFLGEAHQEVLAALLHFIETQKGFAILCGDVGTGKTMLINALLGKLPETIKPVIISNPFVNSQDILFYLAKTLEIKTTGLTNILTLIDEIKNALIKAKSQNKHVFLIIDEAHLLSDQALEEIRLLSNIETTEQKLLHILLVGQDELCHELHRPEMRHVRQRLNINRFLSHLNSSETIQYIDHRLEQVGSSFASVFEDNCQGQIFELTKGVPRLINQLCDHALQISMAEGLPKVNPQTLKKAGEALQTDELFSPQPALSKEKSPWGKHVKILGPAGTGLSLVLIGIFAVIMAGKFLPVSHLIKSAAQSWSQITSGSQAVEMKPKRALGTGEDLMPPEDAKLPTSTPAQDPAQDLKTENPAITLPPLEPKIGSAPVQGDTQGAPEVKPAAPLPQEPEGIQKETKKEIPEAGTIPKSGEAGDSEKPDSLPGQLKPEGEMLVKETLPAPPVFEQVVTKAGETLTRIASKHYPEDPKFGIVAIMLQNPTLTDENKIKSGVVLYLPKINFEKRTIQLKDNHWYAFYGLSTSGANANKIASWFTPKKVKFLVRDIKTGRGNPVKRIFIGDYESEAELAKALDSLTAKD
jgi:type II secretory pathway predicted ATPase ExeA